MIVGGNIFAEFVKLRMPDLESPIDDLLAALRPGAISFSLFEDLPEVMFWVKDRDLRLRYANATFANWVNRPKADILGCTDFDLYFTDLAKVFAEDDLHVIRTGEPIRKKAELVANRFGGVEWRQATKIPLSDAGGRIIGTAGISQPMPGPGGVELPGRYVLFSAMVNFIRDHMAERITVRRLAQRFGMSVATLERRFREHLATSPRAFIEELKLSRAAELLTSTAMNVAEVGARVGYPDAASFSRAFSRHAGTSPDALRRSRAD